VAARILVWERKGGLTLAEVLDGSAYQQRQVPRPPHRILKPGQAGGDRNRVKMGIITLLDNPAGNSRDRQRHMQFLPYLVKSFVRHFVKSAAPSRKLTDKSLFVRN